jgi:hypothetical protein
MIGSQLMIGSARPSEVRSDNLPTLWMRTSSVNKYHGKQNVCDCDRLIAACFSLIVWWHLIH